MNEEAVRLALLVAERTRERDEARTALNEAETRIRTLTRPCPTCGTPTR